MKIPARIYRKPNGTSKGKSIRSLKEFNAALALGEAFQQSFTKDEIIQLQELLNYLASPPQTKCDHNDGNEDSYCYCSDPESPFCGQYILSQIPTTLKKGDYSHITFDDMDEVGKLQSQLSLLQDCLKRFVLGFNVYQQEQFFKNQRKKK